MATEILMPALSPTMEEGTLAKWLVAPGATVKLGQIIAENFGRRYHRHSRRHRHPACACLVAQGAHRFCTRPDKGDARSIAGIYKIGVFRQKPIARMDGIRP